MSSRTVVEAFADAASRLTGRSDVAGSLVALLVDCTALTGADSAGLLVDMPGDGLALLSSTSHTTEVLELYELQNGVGPCMQALRDNRIVTATAPELSQRWEPVGRAMVDAGYGSVHAFPLRWQGRAVGALNLFDKRDTELDGERLRLGEAFANMAVAMMAHPQAPTWDQVHDQLVEVLADRVSIEQAKGVLAVRNDIDLASAYRLLLATAAERGQSLTRHAEEVLAEVAPRGS